MRVRKTACVVPNGCKKHQSFCEGSFCSVFDGVPGWRTTGTAEFGQSNGVPENHIIICYVMLYYITLCYYYFLTLLYYIRSLRCFWGGEGRMLGPRYEPTQ